MAPQLAGGRQGPVQCRSWYGCGPACGTLLAETVFGIVDLTDVIGLETCTHRQPNLAFLGDDVPASLDRDELCPPEPADSALDLRTVQLVLACIPAKRLGDVGEGCGVVFDGL